MRQIIPLLLLFLLLCGCAASRPEPSEPLSSIPTEETAPPTTVPTEPVDPLQMLLESMSTEEKVGQLFLARCPAENAEEDIGRYHLGGYLLFGQDFEGETVDTLRQKLVAYQSLSPIPLLIAVDEEGGTVCRVSSSKAFRDTRFPSPRQAHSEGGAEQVLAVETEKARLLSSLGINVIMGPVCDISTENGAFMYQRSLGQSPEETGRFAASTVNILKNYRVGSVLKHFPGYGNNADTHTGMARDTRSLEELEQCDLVPFAAGMDAGCGAVLISHTIVTAFDEETPASLSPAVHEYIREKMDFDGVLVTDDLVMQAITSAYGTEESAVLAVLAGNDLLCSTEYAAQYEAVLEAVQSGQISMDQLDTSTLRVLQWKKELGLIF